MMLWLDWARMLAGHRPAMADQTVFSTGGELPEAVWRRVDDMMVSCRAAVMALPKCGLAWSMVTSLCADGVAPPRFFSGDGWPDGRQVLRDSLRAIGCAMDRPREHRGREPIPETLAAAIARRMLAEKSRGQKIGA
jgi:hypothetical protein